MTEHCPIKLLYQKKYLNCMKNDLTKNEPQSQIQKKPQLNLSTSLNSKQFQKKVDNRVSKFHRYINDEKITANPEFSEQQKGHKYSKQKCQCCDSNRNERLRYVATSVNIRPQTQNEIYDSFADVKKNLLKNQEVNQKNFVNSTQQILRPQSNQTQQTSSKVNFKVVNIEKYHNLLKAKQFLRTKKWTNNLHLYPQIKHNISNFLNSASTQKITSQKINKRKKKSQIIHNKKQHQKTTSLLKNSELQQGKGDKQSQIKLIIDNFYAKKWEVLRQRKVKSRNESFTHSFNPTSNKKVGVVVATEVKRNIQSRLKYRKTQSRSKQVFKVQSKVQNKTAKQQISPWQYEHF